MQSASPIPACAIPLHQLETQPANTTSLTNPSSQTLIECSQTPEDETTGEFFVNERHQRDVDRLRMLVGVVLDEPQTTLTNTTSSQQQQQHQSSRDRESWHTHTYPHMTTETKKQTTPRTERNGLEWIGMGHEGEAALARRDWLSHRHTGSHLRETHELMLAPELDDGVDGSRLLIEMRVTSD